MAQGLYDLQGIKGVCNATDAAKIPPGFLFQAGNVDIDDEFMAHRRKGYSSVLSADVHSLWAQGTLALFVQDGVLKRLWKDYTLSTLLLNVGPNRMEYVEGADKVFFSNNEIVGYFKNDAVHAFPEVDQDFKKKMVGGHLIEWFNSRLYSAQDNLIFFSDAGVPMVMDKRRNFISETGRITMMKSVTDGMYVSTGNETFFYPGLDPLEFGRIKVAGSAAIEGSALRIDSEDINPGSIGSVVAWTSEEGVFIGSPGGAVKNITWQHYGFDAAPLGAALYRADGFGQYLVSYPVEHAFEGEAVLPCLRVEGFMY